MSTALARDICLGGLSAGTAQAINGRVATGLTATGTTLATALATNATVNVVDTTASGTGVSLYSAQIGDLQHIHNAGANALKVYPDSSSNQINALGAGNAATLATNTGCKFIKITATRWIALLSA